MFFVLHVDDDEEEEECAERENLLILVYKHLRRQQRRQHIHSVCIKRKNARDIGSRKWKLL